MGQVTAVVRCTDTGCRHMSRELEISWTRVYECHVRTKLHCKHEQGTPEYETYTVDYLAENFQHVLAWTNCVPFRVETIDDFARLVGGLNAPLTAKQIEEYRFVLVTRKNQFWGYYKDRAPAEAAALRRNEMAVLWIMTCSENVCETWKDHDRS